MAFTKLASGTSILLALVYTMLGYKVSSVGWTDPSRRRIMENMKCVRS